VGSSHARPQPSALPVLQAPLPASKVALADPAWLRRLGSFALATFLAVPLFSLLVPRYAGRLLWTVVIAALPAFIVLLGYHRWRKICPLALVSQLPIKFGHGGKRKISGSWEKNYYYITASVFLVSLWLRLIATNGDGSAIAGFFIGIALFAFVIGSVFTGKTWCNFVCPVSFIEKLYTEPHGLRDTPNSACPKCTACKHSCPDISEENGYWKELESNSKRMVMFAFPGLVFGFYFYYYLQSGTWDYYFGGNWTYEPGMVMRAFLPGSDSKTAGFFFLPAMPRAVAAMLTLLVCAAVAELVFRQIERSLSHRLFPDRAASRHAALTLAATTAFLTFYSFAGAPTLRRIPAATHIAAVMIAITATAAFVRRWPRTRQFFAEESLARNIVKRWDWADREPPKDLHEAYLLHTVRQEESAKAYTQVLASYKDAIRETLCEGIVTRDDLVLMEKLRDTLRIKQTDYENFITELADENRRSTAETSNLRPEKTLQLGTYTGELRAYLLDTLQHDLKPSDNQLARLRSEYQVTEVEQTAILDSVFREIGGDELGAALLRTWSLASHRVA
jgi:hypothetical protein